jgi:hypothetical protein
MPQEHSIREEREPLILNVSKGKDLPPNGSQKDKSAKSSENTDEEEALLGNDRDGNHAATDSGIEMHRLLTAHVEEITTDEKPKTRLPNVHLDTLNHSAHSDGSKNNPQHHDGHSQHSLPRQDIHCSPGSWRHFDFSHEAAARDLSIHLCELARNNPSLKVIILVFSWSCSF